MSEADGEDPPRPPSTLDPRLLVLLAEFDDQKEAREFALVLRAKDVPHQVRRTNVGYSLVVQAGHFEVASEELRLYESENVDWPPKEETPRPGRLWAQATIVYLGLMVLLYAFQHGGAFGLDWQTAGRVDGAAMRAGEWTRAVTGLTLHADLVHLLSNMTYGALFGGLVAYALGGGIGWAAIALSGALGNALNVWIHGFDHRSIGASTAVFGAVGVLTGSEVVRRHLLRQRRLRRAAPVLVGFLLLSYLGMGGAENRETTTDVSAHLTGMLAGVAIGAPLGRIPLGLAQDRRFQALSVALLLSSLLVAWAVQLLP